MLSSIAYTLSAQRSVFPLEFSGVNGLGVSGGLLTLIGRGDADKNAELFVDLRRWFTAAEGSVHLMPKYR